jgi:hypothetical protein
MAVFTDTLKRIHSNGTRKVSGAVSQAGLPARRGRQRRLRGVIWFAGFVLGVFVVAAIVWQVVALSREDG